MIDFECAGGLKADRNRISFGELPALVCLSFEWGRQAAKQARDSSVAGTKSEVRKAMESPFNSAYFGAPQSRGIQGLVQAWETCSY